MLTLQPTHEREGTPPGGPLGTTPTTVAALVRGGARDLIRVVRRDERYTLRDRLRAVTTLPRVGKCGWAALGEVVEVKSAEPAAHFAGVLICGRVWTCPVCAPKIRQGRAVEIEAALRGAIGQGLGVEFATLTFAHHRGQALGYLLDSQRSIWRATRQDHQMRAVFKQLGFVGLLNVQEITHGDNGWHPHRHMAMVFERPLTLEERAALENALWAAWERALTARGFSALRQYGAVVKQVTVAEGIAAYLAKVEGKSIGLEMARGDLKTSKRKGRTPHQILGDVFDQGEAVDLELWHEYERATAGRKMMTWTPGLRRRLVGEVPEATDEELAEADAGGEVVALLWREAWRVVRAASPGGVECLRAAENGVEALGQYLALVVPLEPGEGRWLLIKPRQEKVA